MTTPPDPVCTLAPLVFSVKVFEAVMDTVPVAVIAVLSPTVAVAEVLSLVHALAPLPPATDALTVFTLGVKALDLSARIVT